MKRFFYHTWIMTVGVLLGTSMLLSSCGKADIGEGEPVAADSITVDTTATLTNKPNSPKCKVHIDFKYIKGKTKKLTEMLFYKEDLHSFLKQYVEDYQRDGRLILDQEPDNNGLNWEYRVKTDVRRYRDDVIAYIAHIHTFEGGLHPIDQTVVRNISEKDGRILSISDILIPGYDKTLLEDVVEQLAEDYEVDDIEGLRGKGLFIGIDPYLPDNFILGDGAIQFIYQCDEIAAHPMGEIKVTVRIADSELSIKH